MFLENDPFSCQASLPLTHSVAAGLNVCASIEDRVPYPFYPPGPTYSFIKEPRDIRRDLSNVGHVGQKKLTDLLVCRK